MKTLLPILVFLSAVILPARGDDGGRYLKAVALFSEGNCASAATILRTLAAEDPSDDAVFYYLGLCDYHMNELEEAEMFLKEAASLDSTNYWYRESLCQVKVAREDYEGAIAVYEDILRDWPRKTDTYYALLSLYAHTGRVQKMLETIDSIEEVSGRNERIALTKYDILLRQGKPDEAYAVLEEYNEDFSDPQVLCAMGDFQASRGNDSIALAFYDEVLEADPVDGGALLGKAEIFRVSHREREYFRTLRGVVESPEVPAEMTSQYFARLFRAVDSRWLAERKAPVDSLLATAVTLHPKDLSVTATRVQFDAVMGDWPLLLEVCEDAFSRFPGMTDFLSYRCIAFYNLGREEEFIRENERIISTAPRDTAAVLEAWSSIGDMRYRQGDSKKAFKAYDNALKLDPTYAPVLNNYAYYLALRGTRLQKALSMSRKTVEANPDNATYLDTYGYLLYLLGRPEEAKPVFKHAMLYGGKDSVETLWHYARVLDALGEKDLAKVYYNMVEAKKVKK